MRWKTLGNTTYYLEDKGGKSIKVVCRFLWLPESYNGETRWLEFADIVYESINVSLYSSHFISTPNSWLDKIRDKLNI